MTSADDPQSLSRQYFEALRLGDWDTLDALLAPEFWLVEPFMGWKVSRSTLRNDVAAAVITFTAIDVHSLMVRNYGNAAIVIGSNRMTGRGRDCDADFSVLCRFTHVFVRGEARWYLVTAQETQQESWGLGP
jgi:ketosteroid isomerase-like protein